MRATIDMKPEHRALLLKIAAGRGERGFSSVVAEAIEAYLAGRAESQRARARALKLRGCLSAGEAKELRRRTAALRRRA